MGRATSLIGLAITVGGISVSPMAYAGPSTTVTAGDPEDAAAKCVTHFFGRSAAPGIGGEGVAFAGLAIVGKQPRFVVAPTFALSIGYNIRLKSLTDRCSADPVAGSTGSYRVKIPLEPTWIPSLSVALNPATLTLIDVAGDQSLQAGLGILVAAGVRLQRVWWDDSSSPRNVLTIPIGLAGGFGSLRDSSGKSTGSGLVGLFVGFRLEL